MTRMKSFPASALRSASWQYHNYGEWRIKGYFMTRSIDAYQSMYRQLNPATGTSRLLSTISQCISYKSRNSRGLSPQFGISRKIKRNAKIRRGRQGMKKNPETIIKWVCGILAALLILLATGGWWLFGTFITAANSIERLEDGLCSMEYNGDYLANNHCRQ